MSTDRSSTCSAVLVESDMRRRLFPIFYFLSTNLWETGNFAGGFIPGAMPSKKSPTEIIENKGESAGRH